MAPFRVLIATVLILGLTTEAMCKIILPHKLRYLENMLNSEVVAKAAKIRQRLEANPNLPENTDKNNWPLLLAKYGQEENSPASKYNKMYERKGPKFQRR